MNKLNRTVNVMLFAWLGSAVLIVLGRTLDFYRDSGRLWQLWLEFGLLLLLCYFIKEVAAVLDDKLFHVMLETKNSAMELDLVNKALYEVNSRLEWARNKQ